MSTDVAGSPAVDLPGAVVSAAADPDAIRRALALVPDGIVLGGEVWAPATGARFGVEDPATGEAVWRVADAGASDGAAALELAVATQRSWEATAPRARGEILRAAFELTVARTEELANLMTLEMGKPLAESRGEVTYAAEFLRWFSEEAVRIAGRYSMSPDGRSRLLVLQRAVGPCVFVTPWNFPLAMITRKVGPAIAAGCTMILKPAQQTPLTAMAFSGLLAEAGLPAGVLSVLPTTKAGALVGPLIADQRVRKLSFTGSTEVGRALLAQAAPTVLRTSMELGGNAPFLVFADADLDAAVTGAMTAKMRNGGEACTAANRFHVAAEVADEFTAKLSQRMRDLQMGPGYAAGTTLGPLVDAATREKVDRLVVDAVAHGAEVVTGGSVPDGPGYFYPATVLSGVGEGAEVLREEVFGPVAPVSTFTSEDDAVEAANRTEFGLVAYAYTRDHARAMRLAERLEVGMIGLNQGLVSNPAAPFGGIKQSGLGREGGIEGIHEYLATRYVAFPEP